jgi:catechol 2,3-dioxygenase-like lactoylglutathione lyase family enzyme
MAASRIQLALNVSDLAAATHFYRQLFGAEPAKERPGYANFEIAEPPLKLVLFENPGAPPLNHLGVELPDTESVTASAARFATSALRHTVHAADRCCHAVQDKVWVDAPDVPLGGWEFYTVLADDTEATEACPAGGCCSGEDDAAAPSTCCSSTRPTGA